jgi:peptidyl-prolyl cis-trans isomerase D
MVDEVVEAPEVDERDVQQLRQRIALLLSEDTIAEYFGALESRYGVSVNQQALANLVGNNDQP